MRQLLEESNPILDMEIPVLLKTREIIRISQILKRNYEDEEGLRETLGPILQALTGFLDEVESDPRWADLQAWDGETEILERAVKKQKKHLKRIKKALYKGRSLRIGYCAPGTGEVTRRTITPLELWASDSVWLLRAYCYHQGEECTFLVGRMLKVKRQKASKLRPPIPGEQQLALREAELQVTESGREMAPESQEDDQQTDPRSGEGLDAAPPTKDEPLSGEEPAQWEGVTGNSIPKARRQHALPGKIPHRPGLPHRLAQLVKRADRHLP